MNVTEHEIILLLKESFRKAAEACDELAVLPGRGPSYKRLLKHLKAAENCCRQVAYYRQDARWFNIGLMMEEAHKRSGSWLRKFPRTESSNVAHPLFVRLADNLRAAMKRAEEIETKAVGRSGIILPTPRRDESRTFGRGVQVRKSGLIIPEGVSLH